MMQAIKDFLGVINNHYNNYNWESKQAAIDQLVEVKDQNQKLYANHIQLLLKLVEEHIMQAENNEQKIDLITIVVDSSKSYPGVLKKNSNRVLRLLIVIMKTMANVSSQISQIWFKPQQNSSGQVQEQNNKTDQEEQLISRLMQQINEIGKIVGHRKALQIIQHKVLQLYNEGDWRWKSAVLFCISQLIQNLKPQQILSVVNISKLSLANENPKVRYAAIEIMGELCNTHKSEIWSNYFHDFMALMIQGLNDPVQRVVSHWFAFLNNFAQNYSDTLQIQPSIGPLLQRISYYLQNGFSITKQNSMCAMSSLMTIPGIFNKQNISKPLQICHSIFQTFEYTKHKELYNVTLQCLSIIIKHQPYQIIKQYYPFILDTLFELSSKIEPQFIINGWERICGKNVKFENWKKLYGQMLNSTSQFDKDDTIFFIQAVSTTVVCFQQEYFQFSQKTLIYLMDQLKKAVYGIKTKIIRITMRGIRDLICLANPINPDEKWNSLKKQAINKIVEYLKSEINKQNFRSVHLIMIQMSKIMEKNGYLFLEQELRQLFAFFHEQQKILLKLRNQIANPQQIWDMDQLEHEKYEQKKKKKLENLNDCRKQIPDILIQTIRKIANPHDEIKSIIDWILTLDTQQSNDKDFICISYHIDNLIEFISFDYLKNYWGSFQSALLKFSVNPNTQLRQSAYYGLGLIAQKTPKQMVSQEILNNWIAIIKDGLSLTRQQQDTQSQFLYTIDNCKSLLGKLLKRFHKDYNLSQLMRQFIGHLPLEKDDQENTIQMNFFCQLLKQEPESLIDVNNKQQVNGIVKILKVISKFVQQQRKSKNSEEQNLPILAELKNILGMMSKWPIFIGAQGQIANRLSKNEKYLLQQLLTNQLILQK